jgi:hypothetical protein
MINNKDPLIAAVQKVMQDSYAERNAVKVVNEKFGIVDRRVLPRENQGAWDAAYQMVLSEGVEALDEMMTINVDMDHKMDHSRLEKKHGVTIEKPKNGTGPHKVRGDMAALKNFANDVYDNRSPVNVHPELFKEGAKLHKNQQVLDVHEPEKDKLTRKDFKKLSAMAEANVDTVGKGENEGGSAVTTVPSKPAPSKPTSITTPQQDALKKKIQSIKEAKKAAMYEATLESIQEEIANNLAEQASYVYENEGQEGLITFLESLSEEQIEILQMNEGLWDTIKGAANSAADAVSSAAKSAQDGMGQLATATGASAANKWLRKTAADTATAVLGPERSATLQSFAKGTSVGKERKQEMEKGNMSSSEYKAGDRDNSGSTAPTPKPKPAAPKAAAPKATAPKATAPTAPVKKSTPVTRMKHNRSIDKNSDVGQRAKYQGLGVTTGTTIKK